MFLWLRSKIVLVHHKLRDNNPVNAANLANSGEFPACIDDDSSNYSTDSNSTDESVISDDDDDDDEQQQQQQQLPIKGSNDDDDVEMTHPVEWSDDCDNHANIPSNYSKT